MIIVFFSNDTCRMSYASLELLLSGVEFLCRQNYTLQVT